MGVTWTEAPETHNASAMFDLDFLDVDPSLGWGVGFHGSIIRTEDGGASCGLILHTRIGG